MKKLLVFATAFLLAGCATIPAGIAVADALVSASRPAAAVGERVVVEGTRGLILGHNAVQGGIAIVNPLVRSRVLTPAQVNRYEQLINQAERLFSGASGGLTIAQRTAGLFNIANELNALAGR